MPPAIKGTAAFSAAVSAGSRLYCWKTKPRFWRRKPICWFAGSRWIPWPKSSTSPSVGSSKPVMTLNKVVLPQPLGPTMKVKSPSLAWKSTPRSASTLAPFPPNRFLSPRVKTAMEFSRSMSASEHFRRLEHDHASNTEQAGNDDDQEDARSRECHALPHQYKTARRDLTQGDLEEERSHPRADTE